MLATYLREAKLKSSTLIKQDGDVISTSEFEPDNWYDISLPGTVLSALVKNGVYPDPRFGLDSFLIPDASDEFNEKHGLLKYSYLPDKRNPWKDPYWYRAEFMIPNDSKRFWLTFNGINYRADVWLNGKIVADSRQIVGAFQRYRLDITKYVKPREINCLAAKIYLVDHPGFPDTQLDIFGKERGFHKEIMKDITLVMFVGYDCMPTIPDRNMGIWQDVYIDSTGPVDIMNTFVRTKLPLPDTSQAVLNISTELLNTTEYYQEGLVEGLIDGKIGFRQEVSLKPGENEIALNQLLIDKPRLWWPNNYGEQNLYDLSLKFIMDGEVSDEENIRFGIHEITKEMYELDGSYGLRVNINGKKVFCRGGYIQPEAMLEWDRERMEAEIRYFTEANLNIVYFEDIPNPPDEFLDLCDEYGLMFGNCFYGCYWMQPGTDHPIDIDLLDRGTVDIIKRYRNHPSLVMYMAMNEGETREDIYENWRRNVINLDDTRFFIPSGSFPDYRKDVPEWISKDLPTGMNDYPPKSYGWQEPSTYYRWVREERNWMFMMESGSASLPPIDSIQRFISNLGESPVEGFYPLNEIWAHHGANHYYKDYDSAIRREYGSPQSVEDYCMKGHLVTADQHRAMFEAANHRMWDITSGFTEWKINASWPDIQWQIFDWFLKPMVSYYYIKSACEPLHIQLSPLDSKVTVINNHLKPINGLRAIAKVYDFDMRLIWECDKNVSIEENTYTEVFAIPELDEMVVHNILTPVYFVRLELRDNDLVSSNFYWLSSAKSDNMNCRFADLSRLSLVKLDTSCNIEKKDDRCIAHVMVNNPTDKLAFFIHLAITKGRHGEEILPVFWDDNYFSLLPGERKELNAVFALKDLGSSKPVLETGGFNIQSGFDCSDLQLSKAEVMPDEPFTVSAIVKNTFIDGSMVELYVDNMAVESKLIYARDIWKKIDFSVIIKNPGPHEIRVGNLKSVVIVKDEG